MAEATLTSVTAAMKEIYEGSIEQQFSDEVVLYKRLEKSGKGIVEDNVGGKYVTFPVRISRNAGISYRAEDTDLAAAGRQGYAAVQVPLKYGYGRFSFTGQVMELARDNPQAFANMARQEMERLGEDIVKDSGRIAYGDEVNNGVITYINDTATSATHAVLNTENLEVGMVVDVLVASTGSATGGGSGLTINSIDEAASTVTFSASIGATTTGHGIYRAGNRLLEPTGWRQISRETGILHGLDPATTPVWVSNRIHNSGTPTTLSELSMVRGCDLARRKGGKISVIFTSLGVRRAYFSLLKQERRYVDPKNFPGGFQGLAFNYGTEIPVVEDVQCNKNTMWQMDESKVTLYRKRPWYFDDTSGSVLQWVTGRDKYEGFMKQYWELGTSQRNAHTVYEDITEA